MLDLTEVHFKQGYFRFENYRLLLSMPGFANSFITDLRTKLASQGMVLSSQDEACEGYLTCSMSIQAKKRKSDLVMLSDGTRPLQSMKN